MQKYNFICDLEFSDLDPMRGQLLECALLVTDLDFNVVNELCVRVRPEIINDVTWSEKAESVHGISKPEAMSAPYSRREFCFLLLNFLAPYYFECNEPQPFYCHGLPGEKGFFNQQNGKFSWPVIDYFFLDWAFRYEGLEKSFEKIIKRDMAVSTGKLAKDNNFFAHNIIVDKNGRQSKRKSYKLNLLCELMEFKLEHHVALSDAYGCLEIIKFLIRTGGFKNESKQKGKKHDTSDGLSLFRGVS